MIQSRLIRAPVHLTFTKFHIFGKLRSMKDPKDNYQDQ